MADASVDASTDADVDSGVDSGPPIDSGTPCFSDEGCSDGLACNGEDFCDMTSMVCSVRPHAGCDDGIACTADSCGDPSGDCTHAPMDSLCSGGQTCDPATGCVTPPACTGDAECDNGNFCDGAETCDPAVGCRSGTAPSCDDSVSCTADSCDPSSGSGGACTHIPTDTDRDGHAVLGCMGGDDCNDLAFAVHPGATETCDGTDEDCSGSPDDGAGMTCVLGSGSASCTTSCGTSGSHSCNSSCGYSACVASAETCGNGCDDDGNGLVDDGCILPAPTNDLCGGAIAFSGNGTIAGSLIGATNQAAGCGGGGDVFYKVTVSARSIVYLDTLGSSLDTAISYRSTSCPSAAITCNNDACGGSSSQLAIVVDPGTQYFAVHLGSGAVAAGTFSLRHVVMPASDALNVLLGSSGSYTGTTFGAGHIGATCGSSASSPEDVYYWTQCPGQSRTVSASLCNSSTTGWDTVLHVEHDGSSVACEDDDLSCFENSLASTLSTTASGSGLFQLVVDGYGSSNSGSYRLDITSF